MLHTRVYHNCNGLFIVILVHLCVRLYIYAKYVRKHFLVGNWRDVEIKTLCTHMIYISYACLKFFVKFIECVFFHFRFCIETDFESRVIVNQLNELNTRMQFLQIF